MSRSLRTETEGNTVTVRLRPIYQRSIKSLRPILQQVRLRPIHQNTNHILLEFDYQCVNGTTETVSMMKTITSQKDGGFGTCLSDGNFVLVLLWAISC